MRATIPLSHLQSPSRAVSAARLPDFVSLMKPRVVVLTVFTAFVGLAIAPDHVDPLLGFIAVLAIAAGAGAAGMLNMWYDADIDALMARTARRPIPLGKISRPEALACGLVLACSAVTTLALALNSKAAALLAFAIFFYVVVYTIWLKRRTPQNIVIGGAAGALPPVMIGLEPLSLFLIVFLWTPSHFWALSLNRTNEYARAGVPMLPVVAGRAATTHQILIYSVFLVPISVLPWGLGFAGTIYVAAALSCGALFVVLAWQLRRASASDRQAPQRLFAFSIVYLFVLFSALLAGSGGNRWLPLLCARPAASEVAAGPAQSTARTAPSSPNLDAGHV